MCVFSDRMTLRLPFFFSRGVLVVCVFSDRMTLRLLRCVLPHKQLEWNVSSPCRKPI